MRSLLIAVLWLAPTLALAQTAAPADSFGPANPHVKTPPATYRSAFGPHSAPADDVTWRQANDEAGRLRGHTGQLRESADTAPTPAPAAPHTGAPHHGN